ncbi:Protein CBG05198 [Caenorhabditis briggsae]|nr:Protein CBG05198 [Caenorhabditis briggsae]CAP25741.1 Protein CBG05198 [Caenorhabditis briggsae]
MARTLNANLILEAQEVVGLEELRDVLGFAPLGPWTKYREPSEEEIEAASTIEEYYTLREPRTNIRSLDSQLFYEKSFPPVMAFLDKRIPSIRTTYRLKFAEIRSSPDAKGPIDIKIVDKMIDEYITISLRIRDIISLWELCKLLRLFHDFPDFIAFINLLNLLFINSNVYLCSLNMTLMAHVRGSI